MLGVCVQRFWIALHKVVISTFEDLCITAYQELQRDLLLVLSPLKSVARIDYIDIQLLQVRCSHQ